MLCESTQVSCKLLKLLFQTVDRCKFVTLIENHIENQQNNIQNEKKIFQRKLI